MTAPLNRARRALLRQLALGLSAVPVTALVTDRLHGAEQLSLLSEADPAAKAQDYVADASKAPAATPGALCSNCSIYGSAQGADAGTCTLFPGKLVKAAGWCKAWSGL
jgi:hypothetical protein